LARYHEPKTSASGTSPQEGLVMHL
jgi:hypothetical protein